ncbi:hypothetical protein [Rhizobium sp. Rhizsp42]|uniref:hypothetical protein n=1 Tax=Rhizobium sp. Rhizsp42 TaxID=3243034 RepID=UPI0039B0D15F
MWVNLDNSEVASIVAALGEGTAVDKLLARPHKGTGEFVAAAERKAGAQIAVEDDGIIDRCPLGAYVMSWMWVSEQDAGLPMSYEWLNLPDELVASMKALDRFRINELNDEGGKTAWGQFADYEWHFEQTATKWKMSATSYVNGHEFVHGERMTEEVNSCDPHGFGRILKALQILERQLEAV